ncbi:hypothetical protein GCM10027342_48530 [Photobacterium alginatilyticum]
MAVSKSLLFVGCSLYGHRSRGRPDFVTGIVTDGSGGNRERSLISIDKIAS